VVRDLTPGAVPRTTFGLVTEALRRRRERGLVPFTVMSCDNLQGNGDLARRAFTTFARLRDPELGDWVEREVSFPNCMVDRITPVDHRRGPGRDHRAVRDRGPVAGGVRALHPVGARGRIHRRAAAV
jgi:mannitol 2-dehydrogenase